MTSERAKTHVLFSWICRQPAPVLLLAMAYPSCSRVKFKTFLVRFIAVIQNPVGSCKTVNHILLLFENVSIAASHSGRGTKKRVDWGRSGEDFTPPPSPKEPLWEGYRSRNPHATARMLWRWWWDRKLLPQREQFHIYLITTCKKLIQNMTSTIRLQEKDPVTSPLAGNDEEGPTALGLCWGLCPPS